MLNSILRRAVLFTVVALLPSPKVMAKSFLRSPGATQPSEMTVTPMLGLSSGHGIEGGAKVDYLLANPGFIPKLNNSVALEGAVFVAQRDGLFVAPELRWDFHIHPLWTVYSEGGIEANLNAAKGDRGVGLVFAFGAIWRLPGNKGYFIRGEVDAAHSAARIGPVWPL